MFEKVELNKIIDHNKYCTLFKNGTNSYKKHSVYDDGKSLFIYFSDKDINKNIDSEKKLRTRILIANNVLLLFSAIILYMFITNDKSLGTYVIMLLMLIPALLLALGLGIVYFAGLKYDVWENEYQIEAYAVKNIDYEKYKLMEENSPQDVETFHKAIIDNVIFNSEEAYKASQQLLEKVEVVTQDTQEEINAKWRKEVIAHNLINNKLPYS